MPTNLKHITVADLNGHEHNELMWYLEAGGFNEVETEFITNNLYTDNGVVKVFTLEPYTENAWVLANLID